MGRLKLFELSNFDVKLYEALCKVVDKYDDHGDELKKHPDNWPEAISFTAEAIAEQARDIVESAKDCENSGGVYKMKLRQKMAFIASLCIKGIVDMDDGAKKARLRNLKETIIQECNYQGISIENIWDRFTDKRIMDIVNKLTLRYFLYDEPYTNEKIAQYIVHYYFIEENMPECKKNCAYRRMPESLPLQRNALRVEIITPGPRCGHKLIFDHRGGCDDDYHECTFNP